MPSNIPKPASQRQRRNKPKSSATLPPETSPRKQKPRLPSRKGNPWHPMAKQWWADVWESPMSQEYLKADEQGLLRLAVLIDDFWREPSVKLSAEIRLLQRDYGLTPLDRRRLEWSVLQTEEAKEKQNIKRSRRATVIDGDPREILK